MRYLALISTALLAVSATAVADNPFLSRENSRRLNQEAVLFLDAAKSITAGAAQSTVGIYYGRRRLCYGTVVEAGLIATKLSDVTGLEARLFAKGHDGENRPLRLVARVPEHDLAIMRYGGEALPAIDLSVETELQAGDLVFMARPDGVVAGGGAVSVLERSLRAEDQGFLGVGGDRRSVGEGILIGTVQPGSAADLADIRRGDVILKVEDVVIDGFDELSTVLKRRRPGDMVKLVVVRDGRELQKEAILTARNEIRMPATERFQRMEAMGAELSRRRDGFSNVIQTDMDLRGIDMGAPIVNLDGEVIGIGLARASRIKCYVLPAQVIVDVLEELKSS